MENLESMPAASEAAGKRPLGDIVTSHVSAL